MRWSKVKIPSTWTWDEENGGWKPTAEDSGRFAAIGSELVEIVPKVESVPQFPVSSNTTTTTTSAPTTSAASSVVQPVKVATPELVLIGEDVTPIELMTDLIFENIGGQEIISIARHDTINGQNIIYSPIKNIGVIRNQNTPENILATFNNSPIFFDNYSIQFLSHVPDSGLGPNDEIVYLDPNTGNLEINVINMLPGERVEVQILNSGSYLDDTIYEEEI